MGYYNVMLMSDTEVSPMMCGGIGVCFDFVAGFFANVYRFT